LWHFSALSSWQKFIGIVPAVNVAVTGSRFLYAATIAASERVTWTPEEKYSKIQLCKVLKFLHNWFKINEVLQDQKKALKIII